MVPFKIVEGGSQG